MRSYVRAFVLLSALCLLLFALASWLGFEAWLGVEPWQERPADWLERFGPWAIAVSLALLWLDVLLPVPSSFVMIANGAYFGFELGALISLLGGVGATLIAWRLGKSSQNLLKLTADAQEQARAEKYLTKWGSFAIILTRPIPILAETVAILSGSLPISPNLVGLYALIGHVFPCAIYAKIGAQILRGAG